MLGCRFDAQQSTAPNPKPYTFLHPALFLFSLSVLPCSSILPCSCWNKYRGEILNTLDWAEALGPEPNPVPPPNCRFWKKYPEEILEALDWAEANDEKAKKIAQNAQVRQGYLGNAHV